MRQETVGATTADVTLDEDAALRAIVEGVEAETGEGFFRSLVRHMSRALGVEYAFVSELLPERKSFRTLAVWGHGELLENFEVPLAGTPCEAVLAGQMAHHPEAIQQLFPDDKGLVGWRAESYCGVPLLDSEGAVVGHLAIFDTKPMRDPRGVSILRIFATRARAEIVRTNDERRLRQSEALFRDLYEEAPVAYITIGVDGRIQSLNDRTTRVLGYTREQSIGRAFLDFLPATARERGADLFRRALGGEEIDEEEVEATRADGTTMWIRVSARAIRAAPSGEIRALRATFVDVTDRKRAEEALRESESRYRDLYEEAPAAYWHTDNDGRITQVNRSMAEMLGVPREKIVGRTLWHFAADGPSGKDVARGLLGRFLACEEIHGDEVECRRADGSPLWIRLSVRPVRDAAGRLDGGRVTAVDVTAHKRAEDALRVSEYLQEEINSVHRFKEIVGESPALRAMLEKVRLVAGADSSVLVLGETGTGKELVARALHSASRRSARPLIKVNCAALPTSLIESELFGHERGAFTGATERRTGRFELADGGTVFLDEIGELPLDVQAKLLRVLQERELERVGGTKTIRVDVRVIAATNRDLAAAVAAGTFRQDLYYRLNVFPIEVPPLRERREDVPLLVRYFVGRYAAKVGRRITRVPDDVMRRLVAYDWPGNIRELENVVERAVILSPGPELSAVAELASARPASVERREAKPTAGGDGGLPLEDVERRHILSILKQTGWRIDGAKGAAAVLRVNPSTLRSRLKKLGIRRSQDEA